MKHKWLSLFLCAAVFQLAAVDTGAPAPAFTLKDLAGNTHNLADYKGKTVVLEWVNYDCPFVKKHYGSNNMQQLQRKYTAKGVVWLAISSSAPGKEGNYNVADWKKKNSERKVATSATLFDANGAVGKAYNAKTTPHMYIIDGAGVLQFQGAIDSTPSKDAADIKTSQNYVSSALNELMAGKSVSTKETKAYGCSVKN
jgi:peroxiredoxin